MINLKNTRLSRIASVLLAGHLLVYSVGFAVPADSSRMITSLDAFQGRYEDGESALLRLRDKASKGALAFDEQFDIGLALFTQNRFREAAAAWEMAGHVTAENSLKVAAYYCAARAMLSAKDWHEAGRLGNLVSFLAPQDRNAVALRVTSWKLSGDGLEYLSAVNHQKRLNLHMDGVEVLEPFTVGVVVVGLLAAGSVAVHYVDPEKMSKEQMEKISDDLLKIAAGLAATLTLASGV